MNIAGMNIVVTGGASGMGRAFTLALAKDGANVAFCDLSDQHFADIQAEASEFAGSVRGFVCDVSNEDQVVAFVDAAAQALGPLTGLINNAGIFRDGLLIKKDRTTGAIKTMSLNQWNAVIAVDLTGPFLCTREFAAKAAEHNQGGVIVNISSIARHGNVGQTNYSAAKAGLIADTKLWATELARYKIRTGAVAPGFVNTPILQGMKPEILERALKAVPLRRAAEPTEVYQAIKFIIECDYFTGRCVDVDGGLVL